MKHGFAGMALVVAMLALLGSTALGARTDLVLQGRITDDTGGGLGGVQIKAFVDGFIKGQAISGADGSYTVTFPYDDLGDQTIIVWWIPALGGQVPELAILRESAQARALGIWSPCLPRLSAQPSMTHDVVIHQEAEKFKLLGEADCMKSVRGAK